MGNSGPSHLDLDLGLGLQSVSFLCSLLSKRRPENRFQLKSQPNGAKRAGDQIKCAKNFLIICTVVELEGKSRGVINPIITFCGFLLRVPAR